MDRVKTGLREERVLSGMYRKNKIRKTRITSKETRNGQIKNYLLRDIWRKYINLRASFPLQSGKNTLKTILRAKNSPICELRSCAFHRIPLMKTSELLRLKCKAMSQMGILIRGNQLGI